VKAKAALVTGARGGIGAAIVARLEADGWVVHAVDVEDADLTNSPFSFKWLSSILLSTPSSFASS